MTYEEAALVHILRKLRSLVEQTTDQLAPANPADLDDEEAAQRRWQIHLGVLMTDALRSTEKLAKGNEVRGCIILSRCIYEYRILSEWCFRNRNKALRLYRTARMRHHWDIERLPPLNDGSDVALAHNYLQWLTTANLSGPNLGIPNLVDMSYELAPPQDRKTDHTGRKYVHGETSSNAIPSWYVHGRPQLIVELFDDWDDRLNWRYYKEVRVLRLTLVVLSDIGWASSYVAIVRREYGMDDTPAKDLYVAARELGIS